MLVLCPKRLRDNWTLYKSNDRRNVLAPDRLHYDVLNHTDLSRDGGLSGDIDLTHALERYAAGCPKCHAVPCACG